jgi:hypothetical protein
MDWEEKAILQEYQNCLDAEIKRWRFIRSPRPGKRDKGPLAAEAELLVAQYIRGLGYHTCPTMANAPFDLWAWDDQGHAARIEVKISLYSAWRTSGRYQAAIRNHEHDLVIFIARNGIDWPFVVPAAAVPRTNLTIWTKCPADSKPWRPYLEAWDHLHQTIASQKPQGWQLPLFQ